MIADAIGIVAPEGGFDIHLDLLDPVVMICALLGTAVPCVYSAVLIFAVDIDGSHEAYSSDKFS